MSTDDDSFDDAPTPGGKLRPPTDSERHAFAKRWASGVPAVESDQDDDTSPIDMIERADDPDIELVQRMRRATSDPGRLAELLAKLVKALMGRQRSDASANREALAQLQELLAKPPNGATAELQRRVAELERSRDADAAAAAAGAAAAAERAASKSVPRSWLWRAAGLMATTILGSAIAIVATIQSSSEQKGALLERIENMRDEIRRLRDGGRDYQSPRWTAPPPPLPTTKDSP